jgi:hypothetical protein
MEPPDEPDMRKSGEVFKRLFEVSTGQQLDEIGALVATLRLMGC